MRIVGGQFRGRSIEAPKTRETRPTMDRTREAVFNMLLNAPWAKKEDGTSLLREAIVLDVFAGSGAYGLEALSHGANHVTFFENGREAIKALEKNITKFDVKAVTRLIHGNVLNAPATDISATIAFFDPPYGQDLITRPVNVLKQKKWLNDQTLLVIEAESNDSDPLPEGLVVLSERTYGKSKIVIGRLA